jgi:hypothetical protein
MRSYDNILLPSTFNVSMFHPLEGDLEGALYVSKYVIIFSKYSDCLQFMKRHSALEITSTNYQ